MTVSSEPETSAHTSNGTSNIDPPRDQPRAAGENANEGAGDSFFTSHAAPPPDTPLIDKRVRMNHLDWGRIVFGLLLVLTFLVTIVISGIGWLSGDPIDQFLPVLGVAATALGTATGYFFGLENGRRLTAD